MLTFCQGIDIRGDTARKQFTHPRLSLRGAGNCSPRQTKEVKLLYRRYKEGAYSVVEFLRGADTIMGNEPLVRSMLAQRSSCSEVSCTSDFAPINMVKISDQNDRVVTQLERNTLLGEKNGKSLFVTAERELYPDRASMKVENGRESIVVGQILKGARNNKKQSDMLLQAPSTEVVSFENSDVYKVTFFLNSSRNTRNRYLSMMGTTGS